MINVLSMLMLEFTGMLALAWWSASMIFYLQSQLNVPTADLQRVSSNAWSILVFGSIFLNLVMGIIYDTQGRKIPIVFFLVISSVAYSSFPFLHYENEFYIAAIFMVAIPIINTNPFVADLIMKQCHCFGNCLRSNAINLSNLAAYGLLLLNGNYPKTFSNSYIYFFLIFLMINTTILVMFGMKDVVLESKGAKRFTVKQILE